MTIDEAIAHAKEVANANYKMSSAYHDDYGVYGKEEARCRECAEEHEQLAEWLEELKIYKESNISIKNYQQGKADAIDEIHTELITEIAMLNATDMTDVNLYAFAVRIKEITDKLLAKLRGEEE